MNRLDVTWGIQIAGQAGLSSTSTPQRNSLLHLCAHHLSGRNLMSVVPNPEQNRREFFRRLGTGVVVASGAGILPALASAESRETLKLDDLSSQAGGMPRALRAYQIREQAARNEMLISDPQQTNNGDE